MPESLPSSSNDARNRFWPRPRTLRTRLLASYALVLGLALGLALVLAVGLMAREGRRAQEEQLAALAIPLSAQAAFLGRHPALPPGVRDRLLGEALGRQAAEVGARVVLIDANGQVRLDTAATGSLVGSMPEALRPAVEAAERDARARGGVASVPVEPSAALRAVFPGERVVVAAAAPFGGVPTLLAVAAPTATPAVVARLASRFALASLVAMLVAVAASVAAARRLAAPLTALAAAADRMAAGDLRQEVPGAGPDELGRLVASFNAMSGRVAATDRSQREFLANVAHDLRTPLTSIRGYARALADGTAADPAERSQALATIEGEAARMGRLVAEVLDLARLEAGQVRLDRRPVSAPEVFSEAVARFAPIAAERGIALDWTADPKLHVLADPDRLAQALGNVLDNALRHTPPGGRVSLAATGTDGRTRLEVRDTGTGMDADSRERAFGRFARGGGSAAAGSGLGLAIVREISVAHGGTAQIDSTIGGGTTVTLDWPAPTIDERTHQT
jgi:two-component system sensor histidine kinase BaeS